MLRGFTLSRRAKVLVCGVKNALRAFFTPHTTSGERHRREQANEMAIRQTLIEGTRLTRYNRVRRSALENDTGFSIELTAPQWSNSYPCEWCSRCDTRRQY